MTANLRDPNEIPFFRGTTAAVAAANAYTDAQISTLGGMYEQLGASAADVSAHEALLDPHPQYLTMGEADVLYDELGEAANQRALHEAALDPHPQYTTPAEVAAAYQPINAELTAVAGAGSLADRITYWTGVATAALATLTSFGRSLIAAVDAAAARAVLALGTISTQNANAVAITGGTAVGLTELVSQVAMVSRNRFTTVDPVRDTLFSNTGHFGTAAGPSADTRGVVSIVYGYTGSPTDNLWGFYTETLHVGSDPIRELCGFDLIVGAVSSGSIQTAAAVRCRQFSPGAGVVNNIIGVHITAMKSTNAINAYGVLQEGFDDLNVFNGVTYFGQEAVPASSTVASLPASAPNGSLRFATDGRKAGEVAGSGTGVPVYFSSGSWRVYSTDLAVTS